MPTNSCYIGVDVGGTKIFAARYDADSKIQASVRLETEPQNGKDSVIRKIVTAIAEVLTDEAEAIGIAWAGFVDTKKGMVIKAPNIPGFGQVALAAELEKEFSLPVFIENDACLFAFAETRIGIGKGHSHVLGVILGTGVGSGIILDGKIYRGHDGFAGEIGHTTDFTNTIETETLFSGPALHKRFDEAGLPEKLEKYAADWQKEKGEGFRIFEAYLNELAPWITNLLLTFNPGLIVFGGGIGTDIFPFLLDGLEKKVQRVLTEKNMPLYVSLRSSQLENAGAVGAALFAKERMADEET